MIFPSRRSVSWKISIISRTERDNASRRRSRHHQRHHHQRSSAENRRGRMCAREGRSRGYEGCICFETHPAGASRRYSGRYKPATKSSMCDTLIIGRIYGVHIVLADTDIHTHTHAYTSWISIRQAHMCRCLYCAGGYTEIRIHIRVCVRICTYLHTRACAFASVHVYTRVSRTHANVQEMIVGR